ncbi:MAG: glucose 1-dehydrogenase [Promethearchaeota archaeon]
MKGLKDKTVLVTGASAGLGRGIATRFAMEGANVAINYVHDKNGAQETLRIVEKMGVRGMIIQADVSKEEQVIAMVTQTIKTCNGLDVLVNNAAIQIETPSHEKSMEEFDKVLGVNLRGAFMCAREVIKHFLDEKKKGVIVNISSDHQIIPKPGFIDYAMSKSAMKNLTATLALEYADKGIRVNTVAPGAILTRMNKNWANDPVKRAEVEKNIPIGYAAKPEDIAPAVCFLASDDASYITGTTLYVDGGSSLYPEYRTNWSS